MDRISFFSSMSLRYYKDVGHILLDSFKKYKDLSCTVYTEDGEMSELQDKYPNIIFKSFLNLDRLKEFNSNFQKRYKPAESQNTKLAGLNNEINRRPDVFSYKALAVSNALQEKYSSKDFLVWVDADSRFIQHPKTFIKKLLPKEDQISSLFSRFFYTETGLVIYNLNHPKIKEFGQQFFNYYFSDEIYSLEFWHDCGVNDYIISKYKYKFRNISQEFKLKSNHPVYELLRGKLDHLKGDRKVNGSSNYFHDVILFRLKGLLNKMSYLMVRIFKIIFTR